MKATLRALVVGAAEDLGVNRWMLSTRWRAQRLLILCYHGFALRDEHRWDPALYLSADTLRRRLEYLRSQRVNLLPLGDALTRLRTGTLPERSVAVTVDDGFYDFLARGYPLFQEFACPVTLYVSTYYVEHRWPVFNVMAGYLLWIAATRGVGAIRDPLLNGQPVPIDSDTRRLATTELLKTRAAEQGLSGGEKDAVLARLATSLGIDYAELVESRLLTLLRPDELRAIDRALVDVQLHTHRHRVPEDRALFRREIEDNRDALARLGSARNGLIHFCYPSGVYRPAFLPWLRELGVESATTCEPGLASRDCDPLLLPRFIDTERITAAEFAAWTSGFRGVVNRRSLGL